MQSYRFNQSPLRVYGVPFYAESGRLERVPEALREKMPSLRDLGRRTPGARVEFRTDSPRFTVSVTLGSLGVDIGMSIYACQSVNVMVGSRSNPRFAGLVHPTGYGERSFSRTFAKSAEMEDITLLLPRNEPVEQLEIAIEDGARIEAPTPYRHAPMVFYGSSITEGGCCASANSAYTQILSRRLDADYINMGFSGSARGELEMADYLSALPMSVLVYDYDHNAPDADWLARTHEAFFRRIRANRPTLPVVMLTRPDFDFDPASPARREVIRRTFENARASGDKNVYFIDGETLFGAAERQFCTVDGCHPNDLGFYRMADAVEPVLREILEK